MAVIGHLKYAHLSKNEDIDGFGKLRNIWEYLVVYIGGWFAFAFVASLAPLLLWGFTMLFSQQGAYNNY